MSEKGLLSAVVSLFPLFVDVVNRWLAGGQDPKAELEKLLASADLAADVAEKAKFGDG